MWDKWTLLRVIIVGHSLVSSLVRSHLSRAGGLWTVARKPRALIRWPRRNELLGSNSISDYDKSSSLLLFLEGLFQDVLE